MSDFDALVKMKEDYMEKAQKDGKRIIKDALKSFFEKFPKVQAIQWKQYTPYFNDGEPCVFGVGEPYVKIEGEPEDAGDYEDGFLSEFDLETWDSGYKKQTPKPGFEELMTDLTKLGKNLSKIEDSLQLVFGDHCQVTATPDGKVEVDEYEHD